VLPDYKALLAEVSTPGDMATVLLVGSAGFVVDAGLNAIGFLSPGAVGVTAASGALGIKKSYEAGRKTRMARWQAQAAQERASKAMRYLERTNFSNGKIRLRAEIDLHRDGVTDDASLDLAVNEILAAYRASLTISSTA